MRKVLAQPLALVMSMVMLVALAVCGVGLKSAHDSPAQPSRGSIPARHVVIAATPGLYAAAVGTAMLIGAARLRDSMELALGGSVAQDETGTTDPQAAQRSHEKLLAAAVLACEMLALLALCARIFAQDARRRFVAAHHDGAQPSPLSRLTAHRICPAP